MPNTVLTHNTHNTVLLVGAMLALVVGTFAFRVSGRALRARFEFPPRARKLLESATIVLLTALVVTTALTEDHAFAGFARPGGVLVGGLLAWKKAPFVAVILAATTTTALLRLLGLG